MDRTNQARTRGTMKTTFRKPTLRNALYLYRYLLLRLRYTNLRGGLFAIDRGAFLTIDPHARVTIGRRVLISRYFTGHFRGRVTIGDDVFFNCNCHVVAFSALTIGDNCLFGEMVSIHDENHIVGCDPEPIARRGYVEKPIVIGNNVWVGAKATILQGVHIGDNAVIGANAVVTRDVPANTVAVGIPARVVRTLDEANAVVDDHRRINDERTQGDEGARTMPGVCAMDTRTPQASPRQSLT